MENSEQGSVVSGQLEAPSGEQLQKLRLAELSKVLTTRLVAMREDGVEPDDVELVCVLRRVVDGQHVLRAFGSPGDWGYNTPIGRALATR